MSAEEKTLLRTVQSILTVVRGQKVNSIFDTEEAQQVAEEVKRSFFDFTSINLLPQHTEILQVEALNDSTKPNYLQLPTGIKSVHSLKYDHRLHKEDTLVNYQGLTYLPLWDFIDKYSVRHQLQSNKETVQDFSGISFTIRNDKNPEEFTIISDKYLVFDAVNKQIENTLQKSKCVCVAYKMPEWKEEDDFVIPLDPFEYTVFLSEATASVWTNVLKEPNRREEQRARRGLVNLQNKRSKVKEIQYIMPDRDSHIKMGMRGRYS